LPRLRPFTLHSTAALNGRIAFPDPAFLFFIADASLFSFISCGWRKASNSLRHAAA
jgi:hypothetical protein